MNRDHFDSHLGGKGNKVLHKVKCIVFRKQAAILSIFGVRRRAVVFLKAGDNARRTQKKQSEKY